MDLYTSPDQDHTSWSDEIPPHITVLCPYLQYYAACYVSDAEQFPSISLW